MDEQLKEHGARLKHLESFPPQVSPRTPFDRAMLTYLGLLARDGRDGMRDGRRAAMRAALDNLATWSQIREWRRGRAKAPAWAIDMLAKKIERRTRALDSSRQELVA